MLFCVPEIEEDTLHYICASSCCFFFSLSCGYHVAYYVENRTGYFSYCCMDIPKSYVVSGGVFI